MPASSPPHSQLRTMTSCASTSSFCCVSPCTFLPPCSPRYPPSAPLAVIAEIALTAAATSTSSAPRSLAPGMSVSCWIMNFESVVRPGYIVATIYPGRTALSKFLIQQLTDIPGASDLGALLVDVAAAVKAISAMTAKGALGGYLGEHGGKNVQGETQQKLDVLAHEVMVRSCEWGGLLAGMVSEELEDPYPVPVEYARGRYLLMFDPLDGSSNTDVNVSVGTIFSVLRHDKTELPGVADYLQRGEQQVAAGSSVLSCLNTEKIVPTDT